MLFVAEGFGRGNFGDDPGGEDQAEIYGEDHAGVEEDDLLPAHLYGHEVDVIAFGVELQEMVSVLEPEQEKHQAIADGEAEDCLLYTSDAADER